MVVYENYLSGRRERGTLLTTSIGDAKSGVPPPAGRYRVMKFSSENKDHSHFYEFFKSSGININSDYSESFYVTRVLRFDSLIALENKATAFSATWRRDRPSAHRRLVFLFVNRGAVEVRGADATVSAPVGGVCIVFPGTGEVHVESSEESEFIAFSFDKDEISSIEIQADRIRGFKAESPVYRAAYSYLSGLVKSSETAESHSVGVLLDLTRNVALALAVESAELESTPRGLVDQILHIMDRSFQSINFTPAVIARELGLSRRTLERACAAENLSMANELKVRRTRKALEHLINDPERSLQTVARQSGFRSITTMSRAFLSYCGASPVEIREQVASVEGRDAAALLLNDSPIGRR